jgi:hypothetical protein
MIKLSTTLTLTLLMGSTLSAASTALQITDGSLTPRSAANAWIAEKASGKKPAQSASEIHEALDAAARAASTARNPERMIELWRTQERFTKESGTQPGNRKIYPSIIHKLLYNIVLHESDPEKTLKMWYIQKAFEKESLVCAESKTEEKISAEDIHVAFFGPIKVATNPERIVSLYEAWYGFLQSSKFPKWAHEDIAFYKTKYEAAKKELEKAHSLVPAASTATTASSSATASGGMSVQKLVGLYGSMMLDTSSYAKFTESFQSFYKVAALRFHSDKNPSAEAAEKFKTLGEHKAWVEALTPQAFAASAK